MNWRSVLVVVQALAVGGGVSELHAATILVPGDYASVLAAVDAAVPGDSVLVGPGTWSDIDTRTVVINGIPRVRTACAFPRGGVSIIGAGMDVTVLDPSANDTGLGLLRIIGVWEVAGQGQVVIEGLTLAGARRPEGAGAISAVNADGVVVRSCRISENGAYDQSALALEAVVGASDAPIQIVDCIVDRNISSGGAIFVLDTDLTISGCRFEENLGRLINYNSSKSPGSELRIEDSELVRNRSEAGTSCVSLGSSSDFLIRRCRFTENVSETGGGASILIGSSTGDIEFCVFERDSCLALNGLAAGILWESSQGSVRNCTFVGCYSEQGGTAFAGGFGGSVEFRQNLVTHSSGAPSVRVSDTVLQPGTGCNIFWLNEAGDYQNWSATTGDTVTDPFYCDFEMGDYTVRGNSPCVVGPCAPVGAYGTGCSPVSIEPSSWAGIKALYRQGNGGTAGPE